jgi:hypothetical protein
VEVDLCEGVDCNDNNECTADACDPADGSCSSINVDDGTPCNNDEGVCSGGSCVDVDVCEGVVCDDTGNDCTIAMCNNTTGECDTMNVTDGTPCNDDTGLCSAGVCVDNNLCEGVDCTSDNDCVQDGTCDPADGECIAGANEPADTDCSDGGTVCDGAGNCVECNSDGQCPDDGNECTAAACEANACGQNNVMDGQACDFGGSDGICEAGNCVEAPDCTSDAQCDDGNPCTVGACPDGMCVFSQASDGTACEVSAGVPGTCAAGDCVGLCENVDCSNNNQCRVDPTCDPADGQCKGGSDEPIDTLCDQGGGKVCDGAGTCVECNVDGQCDVELNEACVANECVAGCTVPAPVDAPGIPMACRNSFNQVVSTFPIDLLNVTPDDCVEAGQPFNTAIDPTIALDTAFLQAAAETLCDLGTLLTEADVTVAQVSVDAIAGANCTEQLSVLSPVPQTVTIDITLVSGSCGAGGVVEVNSGISLPLPPVSVPCTAGSAGEEVQFCSTGTVPLSINLSTPITNTYVGVSVGGGSIQVAFQCNTSSTTSPAPGVTVNCTAPNPAGSCGNDVGTGDVGETPFPESDCDFSDGFPGDCETVPVGVDPSTVCATFTVE